MRVTVLPDVCQGHTLCNRSAPEVFKLYEDTGHAFVDDELVPADQIENVRRAAAGCPERAIVLSDEEETE